ncbi:error-prone DNA polymerase [Aureimonas mangrovi]|uniref:error-prone DNA polymerase n=1 Tax=Aureimonas mangrovi TaxID=2758041 RepID=UPI00163DCD1A|nr:error-prone DNA polymerase [Aureimonas mangrovi]
MARARKQGFFPARDGFCELGVASNFSFLRGASHPKELVVAAKLLGLGGIGLADRNTVAGVVRAYQQAREEAYAFRPGARLVFCDGTPDILAYPRDREGWGRLCRLLTLGNLRAQKGSCLLYLRDLLEWGDGLNLALIAPDALGAVGPAFETAQDLCRRSLAPLAERFEMRVRLAAAARHDGLDARRLSLAARIAGEEGAPLMATNDVFCHVEGRRPMQDVLTAIREHVPLDEAGFLLSRNAERHLKPLDEMAFLFRDHPDALDESSRFFLELSFDLKSLKYVYPEEKLRLGRTPAEELRHLAYQGAKARYPEGVPNKVLGQIEYELKLIGKLEYEPYFITVQRIVEAARRMGILCQGRGSAANSTVCYCIGVTEVNPALADLLFERFISEDRAEPPDIDIDFEHERRAEIIEWIFEEYGRDSAALAATVISYRARSAAREVGKAFGLSEDAVAALSGSVWGYSSSDLGEREARAAGLAEADMTTRNVLDFCAEISGFPRHLSQHVGGFVLTRGRVDETVPILNSAMEGRTIVEWDKDDLEELEILKIDILALGMLSCLKRGFEMLEKHYGRRLSLASVPLEEKRHERDEDGPTWKMTHRADTLGVFQIESRAQMSMLPKMRPKVFYDLVIQVAIVRPGPIQGNMVHPYLKRRMKLEPVTYPSEKLRRVLERTQGVPLFQEQAMQIAIVAAGFEPAEADRLRRAMATFKRSGEVGSFKTKMIEGMVANGYERDFAERCFSQIEGFGEYGFPESHAASFALLVYASCWLKCHYPDVFAAAILNAQPMGFYAPAQLVRDAREHGVEMRPVSVNDSHWDQTLEPADFQPSRIVARHREMAGAIKTRHAVRLGFRQVKGLPEAEMRRIAWIRETGTPFDSVRDLWLRTGASRRTVERLADADAFACLGLTRREALWAARALDEAGAAERLPLFDTADRKDLQSETEAVLPPMPLGEEVVNDYRFLSLTLRAHPLSFLRAELRRRSILTCAASAETPSGRRVSVSGLVLIRQRPGSAKGIIFITVEDETGIANVIVKPTVFERFRSQVLGARLMRVHGRVQSDRGVVHLLAETIEDLSPLLSRIAEGGLDGAQTLQPTDHVKSPLRAPTPPRGRPTVSPRITEAAAALGSALARADEVRRPGPSPFLPKSRDFH